MTTEIATVTSKGQVTIPKAIREALGIFQSDRVLFLVEGDRIIMTPLHHRSLQELRGALPATRGDEGFEAIREEVQKDLGERMARGDE
jgi:antitoxin PrlF